MVSKRSAIPPFHVMEVMEAAAQREKAGHRVLHLEVGQPSTPAPKVALDAVRSALSSDVLGYTGAAGLPALRSRISVWYQSQYGLEVDPARVVVTTGASGAFVLVFVACFDPGDRVGVLSPGYPCYRNDLMALGVEPVPVVVGPQTGFRPTEAILDSVGPLDGLVLASPSNPTGTVLYDEHLAEISYWCTQNDVTVISDEIYHGITYGADAPTMAHHHPEAIIINSFSKYFSMTGWRLGWAVVPPELAEPVERLAQSLTISAPTVSQVAGLAAFDGTKELDTNIERYAKNRRVLIDGLPSVGFDRLAPADGGFYVWADVSSHTDDSQDLCRRWLDELSIAATPGVDFDPATGHRYVRFSYAGSTEDMVEALRRLESWQS